MDGVSDATQYQCDQILGEDCARFQAQGVRREMDDTSDDAVVEFTAAGQEVVRERRAELDALANALAAAPRWQSAGSRPAMAPVPGDRASAARRSGRERRPGRAEGPDRALRRRGAGAGEGARREKAAGKPRAAP